MSERELSNASRKAELFGNLLSSIESEYGEQTDPLEGARFDEWKKNGPAWQKEIICQALIVRDWLGNHTDLMRGNRGITRDPPFFSKIHYEVWTHFANLPPEETRDVGRARVIAEFERAVSSCPDLPEATRQDLLNNLTEPFHTYESLFRETVGLGPLSGGEDDTGI